jgi:NADH-quinone oxidoreductase subunit H
MGPTHVGKAGLLQPAADLLKLLQKETIIPHKSLKFWFLLAPFLIFASVFAGFALLPLWPGWFPVPDLPGGLLLLLGVISIEAIGILLAGYASQSRFPRMGSARAVAQMVSYEVPLSLAVLTFFWLSGSADLRVVDAMQQYNATGGWFPVLRNWGGIFSWNLVQYPVTLILMPVFYLCILAESNRAPFDIPEGESEIIGGFHTEYSGFLWAVFFLGEYAMMIILSLIFSYLFLGGTASPLPDPGHSGFWGQSSFGWLMAKSWFLGLTMIWIRWTLPRFRSDQLMSLAWNVLTPLSLICFVLVLLLH